VTDFRHSLHRFLTSFPRKLNKFLTYSGHCLEISSNNFKADFEHIGTYFEQKLNTFWIYFVQVSRIVWTNFDVCFVTVFEPHLDVISTDFLHTFNKC